MKTHDHDEEDISPCLEQEPVEERLMLVRSKHGLQQRIARDRKPRIREDFLGRTVGRQIPFTHSRHGAPWTWIQQPPIGRLRLDVRNLNGATQALNGTDYIDWEPARGAAFQSLAVGSATRIPAAAAAGSHGTCRIDPGGAS